MARLPYLRVMFATCMLFQSLFVLCVMLWLAFPGLEGHAVLQELFPGFRWLTLSAFLYGLVASTVYGWVVAAIYVAFYNVWPVFLSRVFGSGSISR